MIDGNRSQTDFTPLPVIGPLQSVSISRLQCSGQPGPDSEPSCVNLGLGYDDTWRRFPNVFLSRRLPLHFTVTV